MQTQGEAFPEGCYEAGTVHGRLSFLSGDLSLIAAVFFSVPGHCANLLRTVDYFFAFSRGQRRNH